MGLAIGFYLVFSSIPFIWELSWYFGVGVAEPYPVAFGYPRFYRWTYWFPVLVVCVLNSLVLYALWSEASTTRVAGLVLGVVAFGLSVWALFTIPWIVEEQVVGKRILRWIPRNFHDLRWSRRWGLGAGSAVLAVLALIVMGVGYTAPP